LTPATAAGPAARLAGQPAPHCHPPAEPAMLSVNGANSTARSRTSKCRQAVEWLHGHRAAFGACRLLAMRTPSAGPCMLACIQLAAASPPELLWLQLLSASLGRWSLRLYKCRQSRQPAERWGGRVHGTAVRCSKHVGHP
jgi:hypothetical protein